MSLFLTYVLFLKGTFPGWEEDRRKEILRSKMSQSQKDKLLKNLKPKPAFNSKTNTLNFSEQKKASSRVGRQFLTTFFEELRGVDLNALVC